MASSNIPRKKASEKQPFNLPRGGAKQIGWIMSRADELPHASRALQKEKERDELAGQRFFAKQPVHPLQDFPRVRCPE